MNHSPIDWAAVKVFYLTCRSYKQTADAFNLSTDTVRTRARRGAWSVQNEDASVQNEHPMNTLGVQNEDASVQNEHPMNTLGVQNEDASVQNEHPMNTLSVQDEGASVQNEHPMNTLSVQNEDASVQNEHPMNTLSVQNEGASVQNEHSLPDSEIANATSPDVTPEESQMHPDVTPMESQTHPDVTPEESQMHPDVTPMESQTYPDVTPEESQMPPDVTPMESQTYPDVTPEESQMHPDVTPMESQIPPDVTLRALPNLTAKSTFEVRPWTISPTDKSALRDKQAYRAYIANPASHDCLYSGFVGAAPNLRISRDNPPAQMLAIVADYDTVISDSQRLRMARKLPIPPTFISTSYSGGTHAVWLLDRPMPLLADDGFLEALLQVVRVRLKLAHAFGELDTNAYYNTSQYMQLGWDWQLINPQRISEEKARVWLSKALGKTAGQRRCPIPLARVAEEVEKRYPDRWRGEFALGSRGLRFWDPVADNHTAAIVTETGMLCFTGPSPFVSWETIFGPSLAEDWEEESVGRALREIYFCNNSFYVRSATTTSTGEPLSEWIVMNRMNVETLLSTRYGLRSKAAKNEDMSEVKQVAGRIMELNKVGAAAPFVYNDNTIVKSGTTSCLNTSFVQVLPPDMTKGNAWGDGFPWTASFLEHLFPCDEALNVQLDRFMAEWAYAYRHAYNHAPKQGRVLFIVGPPGTGKNFLTERLYGASLGGYTDASNYLLGRTRFNGKLFEVGAWICNDSVADGDTKERRIYTSNLKQMAANQMHTCEAKFKSAVDLRWCGRVAITLNTDARSQELLPDLDVSNSDKVSLYRTGDLALNDRECEKMAREELPALCAYLLKYRIPAHCIGTERWGVNGYLHPELMRDAKESGTTASFWQIVAQFAENAFAAQGTDSLEGTSTWWLQQMLATDGLKDMLRECNNPRSFGRHMASLSAAGGYPVGYRMTNTGRIWVMSKTDFEAYLEKGPREDELDEIAPF